MTGTRLLRPTALAALAAGAACHGDHEPPHPAMVRSGAVTDVAGSKPNVHLVSPLPNGEWRLPSGDYANTRFSPLNQIIATNAQNQHVLTTASTGVPHGHEGGPLVVNNVMYVVTPFPNNLIAIDLHKPSGAIKFIYERHPDPRAVGKASGGGVERGADNAD